MTDRVVCRWCDEALPGGRRKDAVFCSKVCRQSAWRCRRRNSLQVTRNPRRPLTFVYADPPYPGRAWMYRDQPEYAGEVDHQRLVEQLRGYERREDFGGWALSTAADCLRWLQPLCPEGTRTCAWCKPRGVSSRSQRATSTWEPLLLFGGRSRRRAVRDWLRAAAARGGSSELVGRKPLAFASWLFELWGMVPGDRVVELFPGTALISRAWRELSRGAGGDADSEAVAETRPTDGPGL